MVYLAMQASGSPDEVDIYSYSGAVEVSMSHLPHQHRTGAVDGERIRPEPDAGNS